MVTSWSDRAIADGGARRGKKFDCGCGGGGGGSDGGCSCGCCIADIVHEWRVYDDESLINSVNI